jgi:hypothetical protein
VAALSIALSAFREPMMISWFTAQRTAKPIPISPVPPTRAIFMASGLLAENELFKHIYGLFPELN